MNVTYYHLPPPHLYPTAHVARAARHAAARAAFSGVDRLLPFTENDVCSRNACKTFTPPPDTYLRSVNLYSILPLFHLACRYPACAIIAAVMERGWRLFRLM